jgi:hypothetical protein
MNTSACVAKVFYVFDNKKKAQKNKNQSPLYLKTRTRHSGSSQLLGSKLFAPGQAYVALSRMMLQRLIHNVVLIQLVLLPSIRVRVR